MLPHSCSFYAGTILTDILSHYAKTHQFKGTLWKIGLKMVQIIAWLFGFHGDMALYEALLYIMTQIKSTHYGLSIGI